MINKKVFLILFLYIAKTILIYSESNILYASKIEEKIVIDGLLSENSWKEAKFYSDFIVKYSEPGKEPRLKTEVAFLYNERSFYVGIKCYDDDVKFIDKRIQRRDRNELTDSVYINLDPYKTNSEAYGFVVHSSASVADYLIYNEFNENWEWNGVWYAKTSFDEKGWYVEVEIPFNTLKVYKADNLIMGVLVERRIKRLKEVVSLPFIHPNEKKYVSGFASIINMANIKTFKKIDLLPFLVFKEKFHTHAKYLERGLKVDGGLDFNVPLSSRLSLIGTINPDFGQVEQDQFILNLSSYETYFPENRPFFLEGFQVFNPPKISYSGTTYVYTRRIGALPYIPLELDGKKLIKAPDNNRIIGALKILGTSESRFDFASFVALTDRVEALYIDSQKNISKEEIEAQTLFSSIRIKKSFWENSSIGFLQAYRNEMGIKSALISTLLGDIHSSENKHNIYFAISESVIDKKDENKDKKGISFESKLEEKLSKEWEFSISYIAHPEDYDPNDFGYLRRNDEYKVVTEIEKRMLEPNGILRNLFIGFYGWYGKNGKGMIITRGGEFDVNAEFMNFSSIWGGLSIELPYWDDREPRVNNLAIYRDTEFYGYLGFQTDSRNKVYFKENVNFSRNQKGNGFKNTFSIFGRFNDKAFLSSSLSFKKDRGKILYAYFDKSSLNPVFANVTTSEWDIITRFSYTFSPTMTLDVYSQLFVANGIYRDFKELVSSNRMVKSNAKNVDFNFGINNLNVVLRWEFRPYSILYLVFSHGEKGLYRGEDDLGYGMSLKKELNLLTSFPRDDMFLIKLSYRF